MDIFYWIIDKWDSFNEFTRFTIILFFIIIFYSLYNDYLKNFFSLLNSLLRNVQKFFKIKNNSNSQKQKTKKEIIEETENHILMNLIKKIESDLYSMNFGSTFKNRIFKSILKYRMDNIKKCIHDLVNNYDIDSLDKDKFKKVIYEMFSNIINETNKQLKLDFGNEIYDLVILDPIKGFKKWDEFNNEYEWILVDEICNTNIQFNHIKLNFILTAKFTSLSIIYGSIENRFLDFNGDLDKLIKNYII